MYTHEQERSILQHLASWPLERGQMLLIGPAGVAMLAGKVRFKPPVPQAYVIEKGEWNVEVQGNRRRKPAGRRNASMERKSS